MASPSEHHIACPACGYFVTEDDDGVCDHCGASIWQCEWCGEPGVGEHWSAADCNETADGVQLCEPCCESHDRKVVERRKREAYEDHSEREGDRMRDEGGE